MSFFVINSQVSHPITLSLVADGKSEGSLHLMANEANVRVDNKFRYSKDIENGLRTRRIALSFVKSIPATKHNPESDKLKKKEVVPDLEVKK